MWNMPGQGTMEDSDGDSVFPPDGIDPVPRHHTWLTHQKFHGDCLNKNQSDPAAGGYEVGGPIRVLFRPS